MLHKPFLRSLGPLFGFFPDLQGVGRGSDQGVIYLLRLLFGVLPGLRCDFLRLDLGFFDQLVSLQLRKPTGFSRLYRIIIGFADIFCFRLLAS